MKGPAHGNQRAERTGVTPSRLAASGFRPGHHPTLSLRPPYSLERRKRTIPAIRRPRHSAMATAQIGRPATSSVSAERSAGSFLRYSILPHRPPSGKPHSSTAAVETTEDKLTPLPPRASRQLAHPRHRVGMHRTGPHTKAPSGFPDGAISYSSNMQPDSRLLYIGGIGTGGGWSLCGSSPSSQFRVPGKP